MRSTGTSRPGTGLGLLYYLIAGILFSISLSLTTSVLNMLARDTRKLISGLHETPYVPHSDPVGYQDASRCASGCDEAESDLLPCVRIQGLLFLPRGADVLLETDAGILGMDHRAVLCGKYDHV